MIAYTSVYGNTKKAVELLAEKLKANGCPKVVVNDLAREDMAECVEFFLLNEYKLTGVTEIRMTQEQIAQNVNSAREVVARMLKQFALDGLIENQRGVIVLKDIGGLEKLQ